MTPDDDKSKNPWRAKYQLAMAYPNAPKEELEGRAQTLRNRMSFEFTEGEHRELELIGSWKAAGRVLPDRIEDYPDGLKRQLPMLIAMAKRDYDALSAEEQMALDKKLGEKMVDDDEHNQPWE